MKISSSKLLNLTTVILAGVLLAGCSPQARKARHQAKADRAFDAGNYPLAEIEYRNVVKLEPTDAHAMSRLGVIYFEEGRLMHAYQYLLRAKELNPTNLQVRLKAGYLDLAVGSPKAAREEALAILDLDPKYPEAALLLAETAKTTAEADQVRQRLNQLVAQTGATTWTEIGQGMLNFQAGNYQDARTRFNHALAMETNSSSAHFVIGMLHWAQNDLTNADRSLKKSAELCPPRGSQRLDYANFKMKTGAFEEGKQLLTEMTKNTPDYLPAWLSLAELTLAQGKFDECAANLNQIQVRDPENYQALLLGARLKLMKGQTDPSMPRQAVADYERLAARFKTSPQVFFQLGLAHLQNGDAAKALKSVNEAVTLDPNFDDALIQQAQLNIQRDEPGLAITSMKQLNQRRPQLVMAYLVLAGAYAAGNDNASAVAICRRLEELHPENPRVPYVIGGLFLRQNQKAQARTEFTKAVKLDPSFLPAMEGLVSLDASEKKFDAALQRVETEIERHPKLPELHALRAQVCLTQSNLVSAEASLKRAIELDASYRPAYMMLANLYVSSKKNDAALQQLNEVIAKNPRDISALLLIGMIHNEQGDFSDARVTYEKLLALSPNSGIALNNLAYLYSEKFDLLDKAFDAARKARDLAPYDPSAADTLGWILFKRGDYSWGLNLLQASADKLPDEPEVAYHLGMTYYMMNDEARARKAFTRAAASSREFPGKTEAVKRLEILSLNYTQAGPDLIGKLEKRIAEQSDDPVALSHLATVYEKQGAQEKAAQVYEQVLKKNPSNPRLLINLARLYDEHLNNPQKALDLAKEAYKLAPGDDAITHTLGRLVFTSGQYKWALNLLQQGAQKQSTDPELLYDLARALYSMGQVSEATASLQNALSANPAFAHATEARRLLDLISLSAAPAKAAAATPQIQALLKADPGNVPALMAAVAAAESRSETVAASEALEQVLKRYPDFTPAIKKLAAVYSETPGKEQRAYELAVKARETLPTDAEIARTLGIIYYRRGDFSGTVRMLNQSMQNPALADGKAFYYLGQAQFQLKHPKESKSALQQALAKNLPGPLADDARRTLAQIK